MLRRFKNKIQEFFEEDVGREDNTVYELLKNIQRNNEELFSHGNTKTISSLLQKDEKKIKKEMETALAMQLGRSVAFSQSEWENAVADTLNDLRVHDRHTRDYALYVLKTILLIQIRLASN